MSEVLQTDLIIDDRWYTHPGIGRYATEVVSRLELPWRPIELRGDPSDWNDAFRRPSGRTNESLVYSPGYNGHVMRTRQILTIHDLIHLHGSDAAAAARRTYYERILKPIVRRAGLVLTVSHTSKIAIEEWLNDSEVRIVDAGNGISDAFLNPPERDLGAAPYVVCVSSLKLHKNLRTVILAAKIAKIKLVIVCRDRPGVIHLSSELNATEWVEVRSGVSDVELARLYTNARLTLVPSIIEGFGLPAAESMATGTPVTHWIGCEAVCEIVGNTGVSIEGATDAEEWAAAIARDYSNLDRRRLRSVSSRFSWRQVSAQVTSVIKALTRWAD